MNEAKIETPDCFIYFQKPIEAYALPERFTFPFNYTPHPLSILAAEELQNYIESQVHWQNSFGLKQGDEGVGKMFGVLVVQTQLGELGYLAAYSGKLMGENNHTRFVPPVFDILKENGFYRKGEEEINQINRKVEKLENEPYFLNLQTQYKIDSEKAIQQIDELKNDLKKAKIIRKSLREQAQLTLSATELNILQEKLNHESANDHYQLKDLKRRWDKHLAFLQHEIDVRLAEINILKEDRRTRSALLQQKLFDNYVFLNKKGETKSLCTIFNIEEENISPPSGAGECAAPKLLQYAFLNNLKPIAMAEFWWGLSPSSEIRKHKQYYPACKSKCEPILGHMLEGTDLDENPMLHKLAAEKYIEIIYEDDFILVVNKPADFLAVPGKKIEDSIYSRIKSQYPSATGPLIVHRLDMSTSGLMLIAKTKEVHQYLQSQFIKRKVKKRYVALLDGIVEADEGYIDLPLRVDLEDRPRQLVCYQYGKPAQTRWEVVERKENKTRVHFYPITGRTHQLRVHASHLQGLNMPIIGDDLYGKRADRLYLHAASLDFFHPKTEELIQIEVKCPF